tara:strand:+ start:1424 stop:1705 length:282 start_codon:yes stop_codon:yes gene_type:complete
MESATSLILIENDHIRITKWHFLPNQSTGTHLHEFDYIVIPTKSGTLNVIENLNVNQSELYLNQPYYRTKGITHEISYTGTDYMEFIEIEIKK